MSKIKKPKIKKERTVVQQVRRRTAVSFSIFLVLFIFGYLGFRALYNEPTDASGARPTLRAGLQTNEKIFGVLFSPERRAKSFPLSAAVKDVRVNGDVGMGNDFDPAKWHLKVVRKPGDTLLLTLNDIKTLPKTDVVFDFKCIEGWSQVTHWAGARFSDFAKKYKLDGQTAMKYVGLETPDKQYYVGIDMPSMMQPQTILCYEMNGKALPMDQGYPLRLIIPVKYGIKHLKRIGTMYFSNEKPRDYWAEQGYDYYSGL